MVAVVVVVVNTVLVATTVTTLLLAVSLVVGMDATATGGITTASKAMVDILEMRVVAAMMHTNRVADEAVGGVWGGMFIPLVLEEGEVSGGEIINFLKAIGHVPIPRKYSELFMHLLQRIIRCTYRCTNMNFARRMECNKCGTARPPELMPVGRGRGGRERQKDPEKPRSELAAPKGPPFKREGDWACPM